MKRYVIAIIFGLVVVARMMKPSDPAGVHTPIAAKTKGAPDSQAEQNTATLMLFQAICSPGLNKDGQIALDVGIASTDSGRLELRRAEMTDLANTVGHGRFCHQMRLTENFKNFVYEPR